MPTASDLPLYNSRIFESYLKLLRKKYPQVDVAELLAYAGMKEREIADPGHWFNQRQVNLFHEKLVQVTGDPGIAREAGRHAASPDVLGPFRSFLLGLVGPEYIFFIINKLAPRFTRSTRCSSRKIGPRQIELTVEYHEGVRENPAQCQNRIGFFEAAFLLFDHDFPEIRHTECVHKGGSVCRYVVSWRPSLAARLILARRISMLILLPVIASFFGPCDNMASYLVAVLLPYIGLSHLVHNSERKALQSSLTSMRNSSERLFAQLQENYDSALMINQIGEVLSTRIELEEILHNVNQVLLKRLGYGRGIILLANEERRCLELRACFGLSDEQRRRIGRFELKLDGPAAQGVLVGCFREQKPLLVSDIAEVKEHAIPENFALFQEAGVKSFICAPIVCEGESLGVFAVDDAQREGELMQSDLNLLLGIVPVVGVAIRNAMRLENERRLSEQLLKASELLERRVEERTAELRQANYELEYLYDSVSHDLRTPLRVVYGYGELLLEVYGKRLDETAREYLGCIINGGERMEATLDRMLDLSELRVANVNPEPVNLSEMAQRILDDLRITAPRRAVSSEIQPDVVVTGDRKLLTSVMENLIGNAWKYSAGKRESRIGFGMKDGVCFVRDNGQGFDMSQAEKLFLPFQRLDVGKGIAGHGLGLSMVRSTVERMGGTVWGEGRPGEGATFYFTICCGTA